MKKLLCFLSEENDLQETYHYGSNIDGSGDRDDGSDSGSAGDWRVLIALN